MNCIHYKQKQCDCHQYCGTFQPVADYYATIKEDKPKRKVVVSEKTKQIWRHVAPNIFK